MYIEYCGYNKYFILNYVVGVGEEERCFFFLSCFGSEDIGWEYYIFDEYRVNYFIIEVEKKY